MADLPADLPVRRSLGRTNRYAFCWRVHTAVKPDTRRARAENFVAVLARGEKLHG